MSDRSPTKKLRLLLGLAVLTSCIGCDQATKSLATQTLKDLPPQSYLGDTFRLDYALNPGGFLSLGGSLSPALRQGLFIGFNSCFLGAVGFFVIRQWNMKLPLFLSAVCILAGGIGNLIDRVTNQGLVTDFLVVGWGPIRSGVFNVADMAVTFGAIAAFLCTWREPVDTSKQADA